MRIGIVGLPNAGKSTLFNALTRAGAEVAAYPFTTVDPNLAEVALPDPRLERFAETVAAPSIVYDTITFVDIAGLVPGAHKGEGLGNQFLAHIRETNAIVHVVRCFDDPQISHSEGRIDPAADVEIIETELVMADLQQTEKRYERASRQAKSGERSLVAEAEWLKRLIEELEQGRPAAAVPPPEDALDAQRSLGLLTAKPVLYVANVSEESAALDVADAARAVYEHAQSRNAEAVATCVKLEAELAELDEDEARSMREELGAGQCGLDLVIRGALRLLDLITFFTGTKSNPAQAWSVKRGSTVSAAAAKIHTDMERGFVKAEVIPVGDLIEAGSWAAARDAGLPSLEGRDYIVRDGDAILVKFAP